MATAILLYNGLHFPLAMIDNAIAWAKTNGGSLLALFIVSDKDQEEGYPFPNDLNEVEGETNDNDSMGQDMIIIADNMRLMRHQATIAKVDLKTQIVTDPSRNTLHEWLQQGALIYVAEETIDPAVLSIDLSKIKQAVDKVEGTVEWVS